jgi:hypothetical protein
MRPDALLWVSSAWGSGWQEVNSTNCDRGHPEPTPDYQSGALTTQNLGRRPFRWLQAPEKRAAGNAGVTRWAGAVQFTRSSARHHALSPAGASGHGMPHSDGFRSIRRSSESHPSRPTTWFRSGRSDAFQPTRELQRIAHSLDYRIATELTSAAYSGISSENLALSPAAAGSPQDGQDALGCDRCWNYRGAVCGLPGDCMARWAAIIAR